VNDTANTGIGSRLEPHPLRSVVLGEMHARPFHPVTPPGRMLRLVFMTDEAQAAGSRAALQSLCATLGGAGPGPGEKHCRVALPRGLLRWEQHNEFTTYTFEPKDASATPFEPAATELCDAMRVLPQPGPLLASIDLHFLAQRPSAGYEAWLDPMSLAASSLIAGKAEAATDFRPTGDGFVRLMVIADDLQPNSAGAMTQRLLEVETYRVLALLGLPEAQRLAPVVKGIEDQLTAIARRMTEVEGLEANHQLLRQLTTLAAQLEAEATTAGFRFSASRAYDGIVQQRLESLKEGPLEGHSMFSSFLARRMGPAMRTCRMMEERQSALATRLSRTADLLRTRVQLDMETQNRDLMASMNERTRLQLRMQQTVEGLSVAAVSYYVLGLIGYLFKGAKDGGVLPFDPAIATAAVLPAIVLLVALAVRRIRRKHAEDH